MLRLICDNVPDMIWAKDLQKRYTFVNKAICENLLNAGDTFEPIGKNDLFFARRERDSHPENPEWHTFGEICRNSDVITMENAQAGRFDEFGNVKGKFLFLSVHKTPLYNESGKMIGTVGSARDVTDIKEAEKALAESREKIRTILESSPVPIVVYDNAGRPQYLNPSFEKLLGWTLKELATDPFFFIAKDEEKYNRSIQQVLGKISASRTEITCVAKNGRKIRVIADIAAIIQKESPIGHVICLTDISKIKELEERLHQAP